MHSLKNNSLILALFASAILLTSIGSCMAKPQMVSETISTSDTEQFYVGVTYNGDSVSEAKQLIDRVKSYTNLFVLQSGTIQYGHRLDELLQIVDYAVDSKLHFIVYFSQYQEFLEDWVENFDPRWENYFLGVYFGDEPGGKMLDDYTSFYGGSSNANIEKWADGTVKVDFHSPNSSADPRIIYYSNGTILVEKVDFDDQFKTIYATYQKDGTISVKIQEIMSPLEDGTRSDAPYSYEMVQSMYPFGSYDDAADLFVDLYRSKLPNGVQDFSNFTFFSSDYALYWFDYLSGYDVILAQLGWNNTAEQDIALTRGSANLQNKDWGVIITWTYKQPPYLDSGEAIYKLMCDSYDAGAKYVVIFNYAENMTEPYGILQDEHFVALERFWNEVVQNPVIPHGSIDGEAVLVLPKNYGWGMRFPDDKIWGLWGPDEKSEQIWNLRSDLIQKYGLKLDIVYYDPAFPVEGKYAETFYSFEKTEPFPTTLLVFTIGVVILVGGILLVYFLKSKKTSRLRTF